MSAARQTYADWQRCITVDRGIALMPGYVAEHLEALQDPANEHTQLFVRRWGAEHHQRVIGWFSETQTMLKQWPKSARPCLRLLC